MKFSAFALVVATVVTSVASVAQVVSYVPDNAPPGIGNVFPFGSAAFTYASVIPTTYMNQNFRRIHEVAFQPTASNTFLCGTLLMGLGHVATPQPCPFNFPLPGTANIGSFLDFTPIYDTAVQGPLNWPLTANTWSPLGFATAGGTNFVWDGIHDVAFFVTFTGASGIVAFQRSAQAFPTRSFTNSYASAQAATCNSTAGLYIQFTLAASDNAFTAVTTGGGIGDLNMALTLISAGATEGYVVVSAFTSGPVGTGSFLGLEPDAATFLFLQTPLATGDPLHFTIGTPGVWPDQPFVLPPGTLLLGGQTWDAVAVVFGPGLTYLGRSAVQRLAW